MKILTPQIYLFFERLTSKILNLKVKGYKFNEKHWILCSYYEVRGLISGHSFFGPIEEI